ncbi:MAG: sodium:calcium antiporter [Chloroflexi bacterium]|nr:sodium:calcium antiporter [Chloroflexota bacterium]
MPLIVLLLLGSMVVIVGACELFVNSVEWLGKRLGLGEGVVGSILAAVGTALPETILPLVAILLVGGEEGNKVGIGAILGAPFMLSTAAFFATGTAVLIFTARGRRKNNMNVNATILGRDMRFFLIVYAIAIAAAFLPAHSLKLGMAILLLGLYAYYVYRTFRDDASLGGEDLAPLYFARRSPLPPLILVVAQLLIALAVIILGARVFVTGIEAAAQALGVPALILSLIIAPLATELPEKVNSVLWVRRSKDTLALGNISGAMVFQGCIPVAVGLVFTPWELTPPALASAAIAILSTGLVYTTLRRRQVLSPYVLLMGGLFYLAFIGYVVFLN